MPQLIVEDVPRDIYQQLVNRAAAANWSVEEEVLKLLQRVLSSSAEPSPRSYSRLPDPPVHSEEFSPPFDLPRPGTAAAVVAITGYVRRPDPFPENVVED